MIVIRPEQPEDVPVVHQIVHQAFGQPAEANLVDALRRNGKAKISLVAEDNGRVIGHILFSPVTIETANGLIEGVGLAPLSVSPERQNEGIGSRLSEEGLNRCREAGYPFVIVLGHSEYYPRFGFVPASRFGVTSQYNVRDEVFMTMELRKGSLAGFAGVARYQPEFNEV